MGDFEDYEFLPFEVHAVVVRGIPACCGECRYEAADVDGRFCMLNDERLGDETEQDIRHTKCLLVDTDVYRK